MEARGQSAQQSGVFNDAAEDIEAAGWAQLKAWYEDGTMKPIVDRALPLGRGGRVRTATAFAERVIFGKIVLTVGS